MNPNMINIIFFSIFGYMGLSYKYMNLPIHILCILYLLLLQFDFGLF